jgi:hypothetical protein
VREERVSTNEGGDEIVLSQKVTDIRSLIEGSGFRKELEYLVNKYGYHLNEAGTKMVK